MSASWHEKIHIIEEFEELFGDIYQKAEFLEDLVSHANSLGERFKFGHDPKTKPYIDKLHKRLFQVYKDEINTTRDWVNETIKKNFDQSPLLRDFDGAEIGDDLYLYPLHSIGTWRDTFNVPFNNWEYLSTFAEDSRTTENELFMDNKNPGVTSAYKVMLAKVEAAQEEFTVMLMDHIILDLAKLGYYPARAILADPTVNRQAWEIPH